MNMTAFLYYIAIFFRSQSFVVVGLFGSPAHAFQKMDIRWRFRQP
ncbi:hypothetical protein L53_16525 [Hyphomonas sp. L-53-1-40]|nr:hypothetical protein L53_16525 [Hyphomonas sp. L-53-1-40]